ncbi:MAG: hypothetical protein CL916_11765 [Deltaproteobacteria bacterium]|nr:hypothetical protein [Deltaproteobacteria bacterium]
MKPEQQSLYNEQYLRTRLERILAETSRIEDQESWNMQRAQALLLTPPWMFTFEEREEYQAEIRNLSVFEQKIIAEVEKRNLIEPSRWRETEQFDNLLLICTVARFHDIFSSSLLESFLGAIELAFIDGNTSPIISEYLEELLWDIDWDEGAIYTVLCDIQNAIELAEENIDWDEGLASITARMKDLCHPRMEWGTWLRNAKKDIVQFLQMALDPKVVWTHASSSISIPKPLPTLILWSKEEQELSLTYYQDNIFLQYYGTQKPELLLGTEQLHKREVPNDFSTSKILWWHVPSNFQSSISMIFGDNTITLSLMEES